ncbi:glycosyltransferase [Spirosoma endophyticum]|uniref:Rhamnosyltransferase n=1 Tax=Spirosoma endophyticum TaxID=662367 RepID=A0A1I1TAD8_9BACT|nr:glycosyltransferase [Spirosoma endophyticum]SFD55559.1 rhamnosyltransferase [Spirosoma endophyticum]
MAFDKYSIAGSVILYNSNMQVIKNIHSYIDQINHLFVIDNSEKVNYELVEKIKMISNITYIYNGSNLGVAYALNQAANMAIRFGYQFLLTMDDDTYFPSDGIQKMLAYVNQHGIEKLGIIASQCNPQLFDNTVRIVPYTITSGNLLNLSAYKECGHFMNELFIDSVDHEYCFRLKKYGYTITEINSIQLDHKLGKQKQVKILGYRLPIYWGSHNPLRIYYKTRNGIFSIKKYELVSLETKYIFFKEILKDFFKIIFLENKKKVRLLLFIKGLHDGWKANLGKRTFKM